MKLLAEVLSAVAMAPEMVRMVRWGIAGIIGTLVVGIAVFHFLRRYAMSWKYAQDDGSVGFTMDDLEDLRSSGQLSEEEFRALRAGLLGLGDSGRETRETSSSGVSGDDDGEVGEDKPRPEKET